MKTSIKAVWCIGSQSSPVPSVVMTYEKMKRPHTLVVRAVMTRTSAGNAFVELEYSVSFLENRVHRGDLYALLHLTVTECESAK